MNKENPRQAWMSLLAKAPTHTLEDKMTAVGPEPEFKWLRHPEVGGVMVQGRAGSTGGRFNIGEMTVTRCALQLASGEVGHAVVEGRSKSKARHAALVDALMQTPRATSLKAQVLDPLKTEMAASRDTRAAKAAATKVDFFTMVRGED